MKFTYMEIYIFYIWKYIYSIYRNLIFLYIEKFDTRLARKIFWDQFFQSDGDNPARIPYIDTFCMRACIKKDVC